MDWTLLFKKGATLFFYPLSLMIILQAMGILLLWKKRRTGLIWVLAGFLILVFVSMGSTLNRCLYDLERQFPPLTSREQAVALYPQMEKAQWIVVLGGGAFELPAGTPVGQLPPIVVSRVAESIRWHRAFPQTRILMCGGSVFGSAVESRVMARLASDLGVPEAMVKTEENSKDTADQAMEVRRNCGVGPVLLVSSAWHVPRARALFEREGIEVIPVPADYAIHGTPGWISIGIPFAERVGNAEIVIKQTLGSWWLRWKDA